MHITKLVKNRKIIPVLATLLLVFVAIIWFWLMYLTSYDVLQWEKIKDSSALLSISLSITGLVLSIGAVFIMKSARIKLLMAVYVFMFFMFIAINFLLIATNALQF